MFDSLANRVKAVSLYFKGSQIGLTLLVRESELVDSGSRGVKMTLFSKRVKLTPKACYSGDKCWTPFYSQYDSVSFLCVGAFVMRIL